MMNPARSITIRAKLLIMFMLIGVSILLAVSVINYTIGRRLLQQQFSDTLIAVRQMKKIRVDEFFERRRTQIELLTTLPDVRNLYNILIQYHAQLKMAPDAPYNVETPEYRLIEKNSGMFLHDYIKAYGYEEVFLICAAHGHVMFSTGKRADLGTNLNTGAYKDSSLATLWKRVVSKKTAAFQDFAPYAPQQHLPALFLGAPVLAENGEIIGVIVLQISPKEINVLMSEREGLGATGEAYLVGQDKRMRSDAFLDPEHRSIVASFRNQESGLTDTEAVRRGLAGETGVLADLDYRGKPVLSAYASVEILGMVWALLAEIDQDEAFRGIVVLRNAVLQWGGLLLIVIIIVALLFSKSLTRPLRLAVIVADQVSEGNLNVPFEVISRDEIGQLLRSMKRMIAYIHDVATVAKHISNNELSVAVSPKSAQDALNHSLREMIANLRQLQDENARSISEIEARNQAMTAQNWLKDGISQLNAVLLGEGNLGDACNQAVRFAARYVNAGRGVLYTYHAAQNILRLSGAFAFTERDWLSPTYQPGEGAIGQVALERKPLLLERLTPEQSLIITATASDAPLTTYTLPLMYNDELYGVMEVASFELFTPPQQEFLREASGVAAIAVFSAMQKEQMRELLRQAEEAEQEAQRQSNEANEATVRLEEQQQRLQQQNEELQQLNTQLEEQQQQLEQQREELRQQKEALAIAQAEFAQRSGAGSR